MAEDYYQKVVNLDQQSHQDSLFKADCKRIADVLSTTRLSNSEQEPCVEFCWVYDLMNPPSPRSSFRDRYAERTVNNPNCNQILFLSGYPDSKILEQIGATFDLEPEFFDRHLGYIGHGTTESDLHASHHTLPSQQQHVFQMSVTSIGGVDGNAKHENLIERRQECSQLMQKYRQTLRSRQTLTTQNWKPFHSVVRDFELYDKTRCCLTQAITVMLKSEKDTKKNWLLVIWSDAGEDLMKSPPGPWRNKLVAPYVHFTPVLLPRISLDGDVHRTRTRQLIQISRLHQSLCMLPNEYGLGLDPEFVAQDICYAMAEVLRYIATAEAQYLDMIRTVLDQNIPQTHLPHSHDSSSMLVFVYRGLDSHRDQVISILGFLDLQKLSPSGRSRAPLVEAEVSRLRLDFEYIVAGIDRLKERCDLESNFIMSGAAVEEAQWSRTQSRANQKFVILATLYVPLSFSTSIFGMNFVEPKSLRQGMIFWVIVSFPILLVSLSFLVWDLPFFQRLTSRLKDYLAVRRHRQEHGSVSCA